MKALVILFTILACSLFVNGPGSAADKIIVIDDQKYSIDEKAPDFVEWPFRIIMKETPCVGITIAALKFFCPCENVSVVVGFMLEDKNLCIIGVSVYYLVNGKEYADNFANLGYINTGKCASELTPVKDGELMEIVPPFVRNKIDRQKSKL